MTCAECNSCKKGWFKSRPEDYVCIGVKHPFLIRDINVECTEYPELRRDRYYPRIKVKAKRVDVEIVKHGKWLINSDGYYPYCSECKSEPDSGKMTKYCSECGAKMDKK